MFPVSDVIPSRTVPFVTVGLIVVNVLVFLYQLLLPDPQLQQFVATYPVVPAWFWCLLQLVSGIGSLGVANAAGGGTAFWAHIGGFVVGVLVGAVLRRRDKRWAEH